MLDTFKSKVLTIGAVSALLASNAMAEISVDSSTGVVSGDLDLTPFMSAVAVILTAYAAFWCVKKVISLFRAS